MNNVSTGGPPLGVGLQFKNEIATFRSTAVRSLFSRNDYKLNSINVGQDPRDPANFY